MYASDMGERKFSGCKGRKRQNCRSNCYLTPISLTYVKKINRRYFSLVNSRLPAATETKPSCATTKLLNFALHKLDYIVYRRW